MLPREDLQLELPQKQAKVLALDVEGLADVGQDRVEILPVLDDAGRPLGGVGLRELARPGDTVADLMTAPLTIAPSRSAVELIGPSRAPGLSGT
jgi:hypothetical protein